MRLTVIGNSYIQRECHANQIKSNDSAQKLGLGETLDLPNYFCLKNRAILNKQKLKQLLALNESNFTFHEIMSTQVLKLT